MPELNLRNIRRDLRLPELRLPEMSRDDIAKALGEARKEMREVRKDFDDFRRDFELPKVDVPTADVGRVDASKVTDGAKQVADGAKQMADTAKQGIMQAAEAAGLVTAPAIGRSRRPFVIAGIAGIATLAIAWLALLNSPAVKTRLRDGVQRARERIAAAQQSSWDVDDEATALRRGAASRRPALDIQRIAGHARQPVRRAPHGIARWLRRGRRHASHREGHASARLIPEPPDVRTTPPPERGGVGVSAP